jgi:hypothetical protein
MSSRCLSAGSLRFLRHLLPTGDFGVPYGSLTQGRPETPLGFPRSTRVRSHRGGLPPLLRGRGVHYVSFVALTFPFSHTSLFQPVTVTRRHAASAEVYLRSPVRCFPSPVASFGSKLPWTLPLAFHPTVTSDAERDWEQALDTRLKAFASLNSCDLVSHQEVICVPDVSESSKVRVSGVQCRDLPPVPFELSRLFPPSFSTPVAF